MNRVWLTIGIVVAVFLLGVLPSVYVVDQREVVLVRQFGKIKLVNDTPGVAFKIPYLQDTVAFDKRVLDVEVDELEVTALDQKRLVIDAYARYKIVDPLLFAQTVVDERSILLRLSPILRSALQRVLGEVPLQAVLTERRATLLRAVTDIVQGEGKKFGIEVIDVRLKQANLPDANSEAVFKRMQTQREQEAKQFRAEGDEESQRIKANADRERVVILSEARRQGEIARGVGDAEAIKIQADAFNRDPAFFEFYRKLEAYRHGLPGSTMVLNPDGNFLGIFGDMEEKLGLSPKK